MESTGVMVFEFINETTLLMISYILIPITINDFNDD